MVTVTVTNQILDSTLIHTKLFPFHIFVYPFYTSSCHVTNFYNPPITEQQTELFVSSFLFHKAWLQATRGLPQSCSYSESLDPSLCRGAPPGPTSAVSEDARHATSSRSLPTAALNKKDIRATQHWVTTRNSEYEITAYYDLMDTVTSVEDL
jgi:hypothetical protein